MYSQFECEVLRGLGAPRLQVRVGAPRFNYLPYENEEWSWLPEAADDDMAGVLVYNTSAVDLLVAAPNYTDGGHRLLPALSHLLLLPLDNANRVVVSRRDRQRRGVPLFWALVYGS